MIFDHALAYVATVILTGGQAIHAISLDLSSQGQHLTVYLDVMLLTD